MVLPDVTGTTESPERTAVTNAAYNVTAEIYTNPEYMKHENTPVFTELEQSISNYTIFTTERNFTVPVASSPLVTTDAVSDLDHHLMITATPTTKTPYVNDKEDHITGEEYDLTIYPQNSLADTTVKSEELHNNQLTVNDTYNKKNENLNNYAETYSLPSTENESKSVLLSEDVQMENTEVINKVDENQYTLPVSTSLVTLSRDYTWIDRMSHTNDVVNETVTEALDVLYKPTSCLLYTSRCV